MCAKMCHFEIVRKCEFDIINLMFSTGAFWVRGEGQIAKRCRDREMHLHHVLHHTSCLLAQRPLLCNTGSLLAQPPLLCDTGSLLTQRPLLCDTGSLLCDTCSLLCSSVPEACYYAKKCEAYICQLKFARNSLSSIKNDCVPVKWSHSGSVAFLLVYTHITLLHERHIQKKHLYSPI